MIILAHYFFLVY